jgi:hypothetical protein
LFGLVLPDAHAGLTTTRTELLGGRQIEDRGAAFQMLRQLLATMLVTRLGRRVAGWALLAFRLVTKASLFLGSKLGFERGDFGFELGDGGFEAFGLDAELLAEVTDHRVQRRHILGQRRFGVHAERCVTNRPGVRGHLPGRSRITAIAFGGREVDAIEDHRELGGREFEFRVGGRGKMVATAFESLTPQTQAVTTPVQDFEPIGGAVGEDEQVTAQRIGLEDGLDVAVESIKSESQIDPSTVPELGRGRNAQHDRVSKAIRSVASCSGGYSAGTRTRRPEGNTTSRLSRIGVGVDVGVAVRWMGTSGVGDASFRFQR